MLMMPKTTTKTTALIQVEIFHSFIKCIAVNRI